MAKPTNRTSLDTLVGPGGANFLARPHDRLYPCLFEGTEMRPRAREQLIGYILPVLESSYPGAREWIRLSIIGSGISYNWDESGDIDIQVSVDVDAYAASGGPDPDGLVQGLRRAVGPVNFPRLVDLGVANDDCRGEMLVQYYLRAGKGTREDVLAGQPYACYDLDAGDWVVKPEPITPDFYAKRFIEIERRTEALAEQADDLIDDLERGLAEEAYWNGLNVQSPGPVYEEQRDQARLAAEQAKAGVVALFDRVYGGRQQAYAAGGKGIKDERDATQKLLEVWGVFQKLKHHARTPLPWERAAE